jgi:N-acetylneuraminic acid mutarotase
MAALGDKLFLFGGTNDNVFFGDTWEWNGTTWTRRHLPISPSPRDGMAMATLKDRIILFGGPGEDARTWAFDGTQWTDLAPAQSPPARTEASMAALGDRIYMYGGARIDQLTGSLDTFDDTWAFDGTTWTLLSPELWPTSRFDHAMATLGDKIILFGGLTPSAGFADTWLWDGKAWTGYATPNGPVAQGGVAMTTMGDAVMMLGLSSGGFSTLWRLR